ncbi:hypothetical protein [Paenibacillus sp. HGF7]|uniref:hypothetical protein n=1 Tax=Paenibacillus sp. HGF7 TaxID=944559 RepID=UPI00020D784F|nr:hypothetical protein [Paenibacillus sp. HGF7]EGL19844.1 hypothetical protein HMPREF9413_4818 [Paenibacillus sp. HGF7]
MKTSKTNVIYNLDLFGQIPDKKVRLHSNKDGVKQKIEIDYTERENFPEGFTCFGFGVTSLALEKDSEGKSRKHNYFDYEAVGKIRDSINDGDYVWIDATFNINTYISNGETRSKVKYKIENIGFKSPADFEQDNFKEVSSFEYDIVVLNTNLNKEKNRLYVGGRLIDYFGNFSDMTFTVDTSKHEALAENIKNKTRFGDIISVQGRCVNGAVLVEAPKVLDWGGESPEGVGKLVEDKVSEFQITKVTGHKAKAYKQDDFIQTIQTYETNAPDDSPFPWEQSESPFN